MSEVHGTVPNEGAMSGKINVVYGKDGESAYEIAVRNGFEGTEKEWLDSLKGDAGLSAGSVTPEKTDFVDVAARSVGENVGSILCYAGVSERISVQGGQLYFIRNDLGSDDFFNASVICYDVSGDQIRHSLFLELDYFYPPNHSPGVLIYTTSKCAYIAIDRGSFVNEMRVGVSVFHVNRELLIPEMKLTTDNLDDDAVTPEKTDFVESAPADKPATVEGGEFVWIKTNDTLDPDRQGYMLHTIEEGDANQYFACADDDFYYVSVIEGGYINTSGRYVVVPEDIGSQHFEKRLYEIVVTSYPAVISFVGAESGYWGYYPADVKITGGRVVSIPDLRVNTDNLADGAVTADKLSEDVKKAIEDAGNIELSNYYTKPETDAAVRGIMDLTLTDDKWRDAQGVAYGLSNNTAIVGDDAGSTNSSDYSGAMGGYVVLPNYVRAEDAIYKVVDVNVDAFKANPHIKSVYINQDVLYECFTYAQNLSSVTFGENVRTLYRGAFSSTALTKVYIPHTIKKIEDDVFPEGCTVYIDNSPNGITVGNNSATIVYLRDFASKDDIGDIDTALDAILAIQAELIGGDV